MPAAALLLSDSMRFLLLEALSVPVTALLLGDSMRFLRLVFGVCALLLSVLSFEVKGGFLSPCPDVTNCTDARRPLGVLLIPGMPRPGAGPGAGPELVGKLAVLCCCCCCCCDG